MREEIRILAKDEIDLEIQTLKNPGDYTLYREIADGDIFLRYYRNFTVDKEATKKSVPNEKGEIFNFNSCSFTRTDAKNNIALAKITSVYFKDKFHNNLKTLKEYVEANLKQVVAWDFDKTLTKIHTFTNWELSKSEEHPMRTKEQTQPVLDAIKSRSNMLQIIVSDSPKATIERITQRWFSGESKKYFSEIYSSPSSGKALEQDSDLKDEKLKFMRQLYTSESRMRPGSDGTLYFEGDYIDIVNIVWVDDYPPLKNDAIGAFDKFVEYCGVKVICVNGDDVTDCSHLKELNDYFALGLKSVLEGNPQLKQGEESAAEATRKAMTAAWTTRQEEIEPDDNKTLSATMTHS